MRISDWSSDVCSSDLATRLSSPTAMRRRHERVRNPVLRRLCADHPAAAQRDPCDEQLVRRRPPRACQRSEEHTSELQSLMRISYAVFCLKKKNQYKQKHITLISDPSTTV